MPPKLKWFLLGMATGAASVILIGLVWIMMESARLSREFNAMMEKEERRRAEFESRPEFKELMEK